MYHVLYSNREKKITSQWLRTFNFMINDHAFLHLVHTTTHNQMNDKCPSFPLVLYVHAINYCPYVHTFHIYLYTPPYDEIFTLACQLQQKILHEKKLLQYIHLHKILIHDHHKLLHTHIIKYPKKILRQPINFTRKYCTKKLSQSTQLHMRTLHI